MASVLSAELVDADALARALRPFGDSTMLPATAYASADVLAREQRHLLRHVDVRRTSQRLHRRAATRRGRRRRTGAAHPDYVMTHRLVPQAPDRTWVERSWYFVDPETDPAYAVDFWDLTNRQDWAAREPCSAGWHRRTSAQDRSRRTRTRCTSS